MTKRIFIALEISDEARRKTAVYQENLRKDFRGLRVGWEKPEKLHLTLKFLGDVESEQLSQLKEAVEKVAGSFAKFQISLTCTGVFPKPQNARVLWIGIEDAENILSKIFEYLEKECQVLGFSKETKKFSPHLTIARLREPEKSKSLIEKHLSKNFPKIGMEISKIVIYESQLLPTGSRYAKLAEFRLKNCS